MTLSDLEQHEFGNLLEPHRRELQVHAYRMLGSLHDAEDMVQETFLKAWHKRHTYEGRATVRAWLYKICTNVCLDTLKRRSRRYIPMTHEKVSTVDQPIPVDINEPIWLEPYPDHLLPIETHNPESTLLARENISLAFLATLHVLPARQRAALLLCDVLEWPASEVAIWMDTTVSAVKSALHRARQTLSLRGYTPDTETLHARDAFVQAQLNEYVRAWESADIPAFVQLLKEDATFSMPPIPSWYQGKDSIRDLVSMTIFRGERQGAVAITPHKSQSPTRVWLVSSNSG